MTLFRCSALAARHALPLLLSAALGLGSAAALAQTNAKAAQYYEDALARYEKKDVEGAIIQLKNALQLDNSMLPVQMLLGKALMQTGEVGAAEVAFSEALRLGVNRAEVVVPLGQAIMAQGRLREVTEQATFNPAGLPPAVQVQVLLLRAGCYADLGETRNALRAIEDARAIDARLPDVWLAEVPIRILARQFKEANAAAEKGLALLPPSSGRFWFHKASLQHAQGDLGGALQSYGEVLKADPANKEARAARIGIYLDLGRLADAGGDIAELQKAAPKDPRGAYLKAQVAERRGDTAAAAAAYREVTDLLDRVPTAYLQYRPQVLMLNGLSHFSLGQRGKAKQYLEMFDKIQGSSPVTKVLARIYLLEDNPAAAATLLEGYLRDQPDDGQAITLLASAQVALGRPAKSAALLQQALTKQDNPSFRNALGLSLVGAGQADAGLAELESAYKRDPRQTQAAAALIQIYLRNGWSRKAIPVAQGLVQRQPGNASFQNLLGMALGQAGDAAQSRAAFEKAIAIDKRLTVARLNLARLEIANKAFADAGKRLNEILKAEPRNSEALFELAVIAERSGKSADALRWVEKARDAAPKDLRWSLALVDLHLRHGQPAPALEAAKTAFAQAPDNLGVLLAYSRAQLAGGDATGAKSTLTAATRYAEYNGPRQLEVARLQLAAGNLAGAAYSLDKALTGSPDYLPAQALMAQVELRQGEPAKAEKRARDIVARYPKRAVGHQLLGDIALSKGQSAAAVDAYRRAYQVETTSETLLGLFRALLDQDGGKPAFQLAEQWLKTRPLDQAVRKALAGGQASAGNFAQARTHYEAVLQANPDDVDALNNLANVQLRLKDPAAVKTAELALAKAPTSPAVIDTLGWVLLQNGQNDRALQLLRDARLRLPGNPDIRYHLAAALAQSGRKSEARLELEAALKTGNRFASAAEAENLLRTLR